MNGKPVIPVKAKTIINFDSEFGPKLLCDRMVFSLGLSCVYGCTFCYVPSMMTKSAQYAPIRAKGIRFEDVVMRREEWEPIMRAQLMGYRGHARKLIEKDGSLSAPKVIYGSHLVDVAANVELVKETIQACKMMLELTDWHIRLLSKSNLLPMVAKGLGSEFNAPGRVIYGVSTGTLYDDLAAAFEVGTAKVSKRIESLHWLQDHGFRTFGMVCPSLPLPGGSYIQFSKRMCDALRADRLEHVWAEVINVRGESLKNTVAALNDGGFDNHAWALERVSEDKDCWEDYSRRTFEGHRSVMPTGKLRFLQYVNSRNYDWWKERETSGAVLLGSYAKERKEGA